MKPRYRPRIFTESTVTITIGSLVSEGRLLNLTVPGCLIESPLSVKKGDSIHLKLCVPGLHSAVSVSLAVARWTNGLQFGVEFLKMHEHDQQQFNRIMARHLSATLAVKREGSPPQFSDGGGQNWHLDTYSLPNGTIKNRNESITSAR